MPVDGTPGRGGDGPASDASGLAPSMLYHDAPAAIEWLCRAFGFHKRRVVPGEGNTIAHAELALGRGLIILRSAETFEAGDALRSPRDVGGVGTMEPWVVVADPDAHYRRAVAAGAVIVSPLGDLPFGGRGYAARDPEGHVWRFGTYDPWSAPEPATDPA